VELLAHFGFQSPLSQGIKVTPSRSFDRAKGRCSRHVLRCWVLGAMGSGKSTLLRRFRGDDLHLDAKMGTAVTCMSPFIRTVPHGAAEKYLVMEEVSPSQLRALLHNAPKDFLANKLDLVILTFDAADPNSFSYIAALSVTRSGRLHCACFPLPCIEGA
jgi:mitochondrial Rho GTPase 1